MALVFAPDADPLAPGVITDGYGLRPTAQGYGSFGTPRTLTWSCGDERPIAMYAHDYGSTGRILCGTDTELWEFTLTGTGVTYTSTKVSHAAGSYTAPTWSTSKFEGSDPRIWAFTSFGNYVLATNKFNSTIQLQTAKGGIFADITDSPPAGCLTTFKNFIMAGNCGDYGSVTGTSDMIAWSAQGNPSSWAPDLATMAGYQQLTDVPGRIVAMRPLGDGVAIYKPNAIYMGYFVGPPYFWNFKLVVSGQGINVNNLRQAPLIDLGRQHLLVTKDDICLFDGSNLRSIANGVVLEWLRTNFTNALFGGLFGSMMSIDRTYGNVMFWDFKYGGAHIPLVYNYKNNKWGLYGNDGDWTGSDAYSIWAVTEAYTNTISTGASLYPVYEVGMITGNYGGLAGTSQIRNYSKNYDTTPELDMCMVTYHGNNSTASTLQRVIPRFRDATSVSGTLSHSYLKYQGGTATSDVTGTWDSNNCRFDLTASAHIHKNTMVITPGTNTELLDIEYVYTDAGKKAERRGGPPPT